jgi:hypothetical protein
MLIEFYCRYFGFIAHCIMIRMETEVKQENQSLRAVLLHVSNADANSPLVGIQTLDSSKGLDRL